QRRRFKLVVAPVQRIEPGGELDERERFGKIVIGAVLQAADTMIDIAECTQHQYRGLLSALAQTGKHLDAIEFGHHAVEHNHIERLLGAAESAAAIGCAFDGMTFAGEPLSEELAHFRIVLDHQNFHYSRIVLESCMRWRAYCGGFATRACHRIAQSQRPGDLRQLLWRRRYPRDSSCRVRKNPLAWRFRQRIDVAPWITPLRCRRLLQTMPRQLSPPCRALAGITRPICCRCRWWLHCAPTYWNAGNSPRLAADPAHSVSRVGNAAIRRCG